MLKISINSGKKYSVFILTCMFLANYSNAISSILYLLSENNTKSQITDFSSNINTDSINLTQSNNTASLLSNNSTIELSNKGMIFTGSQTITPLDNESNFAVGKWDNTIQIINSSPNSQYSYAPILTQTLVLPNNTGVQMLAYLDNKTFTSSNDLNSLAIWQQNSSNKYKLLRNVNYAILAPDAGVANSGASIYYNGIHYFISGHENGYIIIWEFKGSDLKFIKRVNIQSQNPISSPYPLKNIRGISPWRNGKFVTGSEDGDLVLANITGKILTRVRYNQNAQRGINQTQIFGDYLLVSNCEVGANDKNLWLYSITDNKINYLDSLNLKKDKTLAQVFNFGIALGEQNGQTLFFASTEEGILWHGLITNNKLNLTGNTNFGSNIGSVLYYNPLTSTLAEAAYNTQIFKISV